MKTFSASLLLLGLAAVSSADLGRYRVIDLGLMGGSFNSAVGINNNGMVVGNVTDAAGLVRGWQHNVYTGETTILSRPSDFTHVRVRDINDNGRMVGYGMKTMSTGNRMRGLYWSGAVTPVQITPFDGTATGESYLIGINHFNMCVGAASGKLYSGTPSAMLQGMSYNGSSNTKTFRGTLGNTSGTAANTSMINAINSTGVTVGYTRTTTADNVGMRDNGSGGMFSITNPLASAHSTSVEDINDYNFMVGTFWPQTGQSRAFYKDNYGTTTIIPQLPYTGGNGSSAARAVNNYGYVAGNNQTANGLRATVFNGTTLTDLNTISDGQMFNYIGSANDINEHFMIAGDLGPAGNGRACVLMPVQEINVTCMFEDTSLTGYVDWEIRNSAGSVVDTGEAMPNDGQFKVNTIFWGEGTLTMKPSHWLARTQSIYLSSPFSVMNTNAYFYNGDCNNDNVVDIADYAILAAAFDSVYGGSNWNYMADLNADQIVDIADYAILARNFDMVGQ